MEKEIKYSNGEIKISWKPYLCQHSGICVKMLPQVYRPKEKLWITMENASTQQLMEQVDKCPSKALTYAIIKKQD